MTTRRWLLAAGALVVVMVVASMVALFFIDEPLRRYTEGKMNARLKGYTVTIEKLHFSPINFSIDLRNTVIVQNQYPDPPVATSSACMPASTGVPSCPGASSAIFSSSTRSWC